MRKQKTDVSENVTADSLSENQKTEIQNSSEQTYDDEAVVVDDNGDVVDSEEGEAADSDEDSDEVSFADLGLDEETLKAVEKKGFKTPSPIQVLAIPRLLNGDTNLIARARTGTGKTAAFGLPIIQSIREKSNAVQALILEPTRELAMQTCTEMQSFASETFPRTTVLYGGASYSNQIRELKRGCEIVVGTPGRIKDHLERKTLDLSKIKYFILDEGDEMLDMGFIDDIREIFQQANQDARILLFSATMPAPILKIAADFMGEYEIIEEEKVIDEALAIDQQYWVVRESEKIEALVRLIDISPDFYGVVFTQTKNDADNVTRQLDMRGYEADALHGDIMQNQREKVLERLRMKKTRILVATDVAARGIDIKDLTHVVNYSLPFDAATYVHRIGRTGRAGAEGMAVTFVRPEERRKLRFMTQAVAKASKGELKEGTIPAVNEVISVKEKRVIDELKAKLFEQAQAEVAEGSEIVEGAAMGTDAFAAESAVIAAQSEVVADAAAVSAAAEQTAGALQNAAGESAAATEGNAESSDASASAGETASGESAASDTAAVPNRRLNSELVTSRYTKLAEELSEGQNQTELIAALLNVVYGEKLSPKHYGKISGSGRDFTSRGDQTRIFVSLGKKNGYHAKEIADYFSKLLHIPGRMVDQIDVAQQFSLVSLPVASARKAIELSKSDRSLPHMHVDSKEEGGGRRRGGRDRDGYGSRSRDREGFGGRDRGFGGRDREGGERRGRGEGRGRGGHRDGERSGRPNVHTPTERNSSRSASRKGASAFVKSGKAERF